MADIVLNGKTYYNVEEVMLPDGNGVYVAYSQGGGSSGADGEDGGYYTPSVSQPNENTMKVAYVPSKADMPSVAAKTITLPSGKDGAPGKDGDDYVLTEADKAEIAEQAAQLVDVPGGGGFVASTEPPEDTSLLWVDTDDNSGSDGGSDYPSDDHINALIDAKLGVIANASY